MAETGDDGRAATRAERRARVLVVDDEASIAEVVQVALASDGYDVRVAGDGRAGLAMAEELRPDLVLLDLMLPEVDGFEVSRRLRADVTTSSAAIIIVSALTDVDHRVTGLLGGADDYITKPFDVAELLARVEVALRRMRQLRDVSPLTGLPGNAEILRQLQGLLDTGQPFTLMHADLDHFKAYNDQYGFVKGDEVIGATGTMLKELLAGRTARPRFLGHVGGDDFAIMVEPAVALELAPEIIASFDALAPQLYTRDDWALGVVELPGRDGTVRRMPLLSMSIGMVCSEQHRFTSTHEVATVAAQMKQVAKSAPGSQWRLDRRRSGPEH